MVCPTAAPFLSVPLEGVSLGSYLEAGSLCSLLLVDTLELRLLDPRQRISRRLGPTKALSASTLAPQIDSCGRSALPAATQQDSQQTP